jgi:hypothetical protein
MYSLVKIPSLVLRRIIRIICTVLVPGTVQWSILLLGNVHVTRVVKWRLVQDLSSLTDDERSVNARIDMDRYNEMIYGPPDPISWPSA